MLVVLAAAVPTWAHHGTEGDGMSFLTLEAAFTQDIHGVTGVPAGQAPVPVFGVAFAPDGDPFAAGCTSGLARFDSDGSVPADEDVESELHPATFVAFDYSWDCHIGISNHPNGDLYLNTNSGIGRLDADTAERIDGPFGGTSQGLGIVVDPQTWNLVYPDFGGEIRYVDPDFTTAGSFSTATTGDVYDGIAFDPSGEFLFLANATLGPTGALTIIRRDGTLVRHEVSVYGRPDGIVFHNEAPRFVLSSNTNGTITRYDFPGDDFTAAPSQSLFAGGGFYGDLAAVGEDACAYLAQADGSRYDNGATDPRGSIVRICGGFARPPAGPRTKGDCKLGGWRRFDVFRNQGTCENWVNHVRS